MPHLTADQFGHRLGPFGRGQVLHRDVDRRSPAVRGGQRGQPGQRLARGAHLLQRHDLPSTICSSGLTDKRRGEQARPPRRSARRAAGTRGCRRRTARGCGRPRRSPRSCTSAAVPPPAAHVGRGRDREPQAHPGRARVDHAHHAVREVLRREHGRLPRARQRRRQVHRHDVRRAGRERRSVGRGELGRRRPRRRTPARVSRSAAATSSAPTSTPSTAAREPSVDPQRHHRDADARPAPAAATTSSR